MEYPASSYVNLYSYVLEETDGIRDFVFASREYPTASASRILIILTSDIPGNKSTIMDDRDIF